MRKIYKHFNLLDGTLNMAVKNDMALVVDNGRIISIEEAKNINDDSAVDLQGKYLIPGLINLHVHTPGTGFPKKKETDSKKLAKLVMSNPLLRLYGKKMCKDAVKTELLSGVTTIRTVGGLGHFDSEIRDQVKNNKTVGPRIISCDGAVTVVGGHMEGSVAFGASSDEEFVSFIEDNVKANVDWIKIMITGGVLDAKVKGEPGDMKMNAHQVKLCTDVAHKLGKKVCAHVESPKGIEVALENGVDCIEHGANMTEAVVKLFKEKQATLVCTLSPAVPLATFPKELTKVNDVVVFNTQVLLEGIIAGSKECLAQNITVGLGTDTVCPFVTHYDMWRELEYYHKLVGVSRNYALHTATSINSSILGLDKETGTIEVGKSADFVVVDNNPLDGFDTIRKPYMVVSQGKEYLQPQVKKNDICERELDNYLKGLH